MSTTTTSAFETSFGMFVPCDKATYRKLKRIYHLDGQFAWPEAARWDRSQRRLPKNRHYRRFDPALGHKVRIPISERMLFSPFYGLHPMTGEEQYVATTILWDDFADDYKSARHPVASADAVKPLKLSLEQIDELLAQIEEWHRSFRG